MVEKLAIEIALEGGEEMQRQFAAATSSISKLGNTAEEAFAGASAAAQKFSASTAELGKVEGVIRALSARARDSSTSFSELAANYDAARQSAGSFVAGAAKVEQATKNVGVSASETRTAVNALAQGLNVMGAGPMGRIATAVANIGTRFGALAIAAAAIGGTSVALIKFASAAEDAFKALDQLQKASGDSLKNVSAMANAFARGGTPIKEFAAAFGKLSLNVAEASRTMADDVVQSTQRIEQAYQGVAQAALGVESAELNLRKAQLARREQRSGQIDPDARRRIANAEAALRVEQAEQQLVAARLAQQQAEHNLRVAQANDLQKIIGLYEKLGQGAEVAFDPLTTQATKTAALLATLAKAGNNWKSVLADILKNSSELERVQIGKALGLSPEMIQTLSAGSAKLNEMAQKARQLGIALDEVDKKNLQRLIQSQNESGALFDAIKEKMGALVAPAIASFWEGFTARLQELIPTFTQIAASIGRMDFSSLGAAAANFIALLAKIGAGWAAIISGQVNFSDVLSKLLQEAGTALVELAVIIGGGIGKGIIQGIISAIQAGIGSVVELLKRALGFGGPAPAGAGAPGGMARGGLLGGRGTGTSDSNLAWVSRGEHIMPARAVAQPGVLGFLEALRRSGGNLRDVLDGMGRFALGGMVPRPAMAFAGGGLAGGSNVTIQFPGLPPIGGLRASSDVVDQLHRAAALAQVRSGGRKPSRYS